MGYCPERFAERTIERASKQVEGKLMFKWKTLCILAAVLLSVPLVHLSAMVSKDLGRYLNPSPSAWDSEISALIDADLDIALPDRPLLVVGGQRVRLWKDLTNRLRPIPTLLRPLGDATLEDLTHHYGRLVAFYRPRALVLFPGYADLHIRDRKHPQEFETELRRLFELDEAYGSSEWRYVIAPLMMPLHPRDDERLKAMAERAKRVARESTNLTFIDPNPLLRGPNGRPNPAYFRGDGVNLNAEGYARVTLLLTDAVRKNKSLLFDQRQED